MTISVLVSAGTLASVQKTLAEDAQAKPALPLLEELRKNFTLQGQPIPPEAFRDMGDGDMADSRSIIVTIDVKAAIGSNLYSDPIKVAGDWITQTKAAGKGGEPVEASSYRFIGTTQNKLLVVIASYSGGGSGVFYALHILDAQAARAFDSEGKLYDRLNITNLRDVVLGDRWNGTVKITGNTIAITTTAGIPNGPDQKPSTKIVKAERP